MQISSVRNPVAELREIGIADTADVHYQLTPEVLVTQTLSRQQGILADNGALAVNTGEFTGRSPKDKFIVKDELTATTVNWNDFNQPLAPAVFDNLYAKITQYFAGKEVWMRDCYACAHPEYR